MDNSPFAPLFTSDLARQVRETFEEMLGFGATVTAATQETVHRFEGAIREPEDGPVIILALAALQVEHRMLFSSIRDAALELIDAGVAERLSAPDAASRRKVRQVLEDLAEILRATQAEDGDEENGAEEEDDEE